MENKNKTEFQGVFTWLGLRCEDEEKRVFGIRVKEKSGFVFIRALYNQDPEQWDSKDIQLYEKMYQEMFEIVKKFAQNNKLPTGSYEIGFYTNKKSKTKDITFPTIWIELGESEKPNKVFRKLQKRLTKTGKLTIKQFLPEKAD